MAEVGGRGQSTGPPPPPPAGGPQLIHNRGSPGAGTRTGGRGEGGLERGGRGKEKIEVRERKGASKED